MPDIKEYIRLHLYKNYKDTKQMHTVKSPDNSFSYRERKARQLDPGNIILDLTLLTKSIHFMICQAEPLQFVQRFVSDVAFNKNIL